MNGTYFLCAAIALASTAGPAAATNEWRGGAFLTKVSKPCIAEGFEQGAYFNTRFRPPSVDGNLNETRLTLIGNFFAFSMRAAGAVGAKFEFVDAGGVGSGPYFLADKTTALRFTSVTPKPTATTETIEIEGQIQNFVGAEGCTVDFRASLGPRPD